MPDGQPRTAKGLRGVGWLLAPAIAIMERLSYARKFLVICLLFALPLSWLIVLLIGELNQKIRFARQETAGLRYLGPLRRLLEHTVQSRQLAARYAAGEVVRRPELVRKQADLETDLVELSAIDTKLGDDLRTRGKVRSLEENCRNLRTELLGAPEPKFDGLHAALLTEILELLSHVGDTSNLILDPHLASYYLMDVVLLKVPEGQLSVSRLAALKTIAVEERSEAARLVSLVRDNLDKTRAAMTRAYQNNPGLEARLDTAVLGLTTATDDFLAVEHNLARERPGEPLPARFHERAAAVQAAGFKLWDRTSQELDEVLAGQIRYLEHRRTFILLFAGCVVLLVSYLLVGYYVSVTRTVRGLEGITQRMLSGEMEHTVAVSAHDELGRVVMAFNRIAERLRSEWQLAREESARATAAEEDMRAARLAAEQASRAKSQFLASMSHEIRTPLNAILGMSSLLMNTELTAEQRQFARISRSSGEGLLAIINEILDFSKIEAGKLELESAPFDLRACVEEALDLSTFAAGDKGLELAYELDGSMPARVVGDPTRLRQVLANLVGNAVKFTPQGEVVVRASGRTAAHDEWELSFRVSDTGIGIPPERRERLFQAFSQVDASTTRQYGGTGLGLVICKHLVERMGGQIDVESHPGQGSTFHFTVRVGAVRESPSGAIPALVLIGKRALVVDDNTTNRLILTRQLHQCGIVTRDTASPREALGWIEAGDHFDLGLLDILMPEMGGVELAERIRQRVPATVMPLVGFTTVSRRDAHAECSAFDAFVTKPLRPAQLRSVLEELWTEAQPERKASTGEFDVNLGQRWPMRILVAEDVPVNQLMIREILKRLGYLPDVVGNGQEVLQSLQRQHYDLILMDVQMPEMDGLECTRAIAARLNGKSRPRIVALTAGALSGDAERCRDAGMDDFLAKPIVLKDLHACLERWGRQWAEDNATVEGEAIDWDTLRRLRELERLGEPGLVEQVIAGCRQAIPGQLAAMREALTAKEFERLRRAAHRLRGMAANVGARAVAQTCQALEQYEPHLSNRDGLELLRELERRCDAALTAIASRGTLP